MCFVNDTEYTFFFQERLKQGLDVDHFVKAFTICLLLKNKEKRKTAYLTARQLLEVAVTIPTTIYLFTLESAWSLSMNAFIHSFLIPRNLWPKYFGGNSTTHYFRITGLTNTSNYFLYSRRNNNLSLVFQHPAAGFYNDHTDVKMDKS